jgi:hypothetical protein
VLNNSCEQTITFVADSDAEKRIWLTEVSRTITSLIDPYLKKKRTLSFPSPAGHRLKALLFSRCLAFPPGSTRCRVTLTPLPSPRKRRRPAIMVRVRSVPVVGNGTAHTPRELSSPSFPPLLIVLFLTCCVHRSLCVKVGFGAYKDKFEDNRMTGKLLLSLTKLDLKTLHISKLGHRLR